MNSPALGLRVASLLSGLICLAHIVRLVVGFELRIGSRQVALWPSAVAALVAFGLGLWFWWLTQSADKPASAPPPG